MKCGGTIPQGNVKTGSKAVSFQSSLIPTRRVGLEVTRTPAMGRVTPRQLRKQLPIKFHRAHWHKRHRHHAFTKQLKY